MLRYVPLRPRSVASTAIAPMYEVVEFLPAAYTSSCQSLTWFTTNPNVTFFKPDFLLVFQLNVRPMLGIPKLVAVFLYVFSKYGSVPSEYGDTPWVVFELIVSAGVMENWAYFATALPAGLRLIEPRSPPRAVNASPMAMVLADP